MSLAAEKMETLDLGNTRLDRRAVLLLNRLGQLFEQTVLANQVFRLLVVGQQAGQQFLRYFVLLDCHCVCGQTGSRLRWIVRLHKILHTLQIEGLGPLSVDAPDRVLCQSRPRQGSICSQCPGSGLTHPVAPINVWCTIHRLDSSNNVLSCNVFFFKPR